MSDSHPAGKTGFINDLNRRELMVRAGGLGLSATALGGLLAACGGSSTGTTTTGSATSASVGAARRGGTLTYAFDYIPGALLDPMNSALSTNGDIWTTVQLYDQLVELLPGSLSPQPGLAESWDVDKGGTEYTFHLRPGVSFSNGQPVTAEDVRWSIAHWANPKLNSYSFMAAGFKGIKILDPHTVQISLQYPVGAILDYLTHFTASIVPANLVQQQGKNFNKAPVGSGPFMLESRVPNQALHLVRNPHYWRSGQPYLDGVKFLYVPDDNARILEVLTGGYDVAGSIPFAARPRARSVRSGASSGACRGGWLRRHQ